MSMKSAEGVMVFEEAKERLVAVLSQYAGGDEVKAAAVAAAALNALYCKDGIVFRIGSRSSIFHEGD